jgi:hypothetical protein
MLGIGIIFIPSLKHVRALDNLQSGINHVRLWGNGQMDIKHTRASDNVQINVKHVCGTIKIFNGLKYLNTKKQ